MAPEGLVVGWFIGVVMAAVLFGMMAWGARSAEEQSCMAEHKVPACERVVEWIPLVRRGE